MPLERRQSEIFQAYGSTSYLHNKSSRAKKKKMRTHRTIKASKMKRRTQKKKEIKVYNFYSSFFLFKY